MGTVPEPMAFRKVTEGRSHPLVATLVAAAAAFHFAIHIVHAEERSVGNLQITSPAFSHNGMIPSKYTCDGADVNPALRITDVPDKARSLVLIVDDPDAPAGTWVHWVVWNIGPAAREIPENSVPPEAIQGTNDFGNRSYGGPCPPSGTHRYFFKLYALDASVTLKAGATKAQVEGAMSGHVIGKAEIVGVYGRTQGSPPRR